MPASTVLAQGHFGICQVSVKLNVCNDYSFNCVHMQPTATSI